MLTRLVASSPLLVAVGYIRLKVVVLKDDRNKAAHAQAAQLACEAAAAIRTVASLTREESCCKQYSKSLEEPLSKSNRSAIWSTMLYAFSQASSLFVIALIFWYGAKLVSTLEYDMFLFFVVLMVLTSFPVDSPNTKVVL